MARLQNITALAVLLIGLAFSAGCSSETTPPAEPKAGQSKPPASTPAPDPQQVERLKLIFSLRFDELRRIEKAESQLSLQTAEPESGTPEARGQAICNPISEYLIIKDAIVQMKGPNPPVSWKETLVQSEAGALQSQHSLAFRAVIGLLTMLDPGVSRAGAMICIVEDARFSLANPMALGEQALKLINAENLKSENFDQPLPDIRNLVLNAVKTDLKYFQASRFFRASRHEDVEKCVAVILNEAKRVLGVTPAQLEAVAPMIEVTKGLTDWAEENCYGNPAIMQSR